MNSVLLWDGWQVHSPSLAELRSQAKEVLSHPAVPLVAQVAASEPKPRMEGVLSLVFVRALLAAAVISAWMFVSSYLIILNRCACLMITLAVTHTYNHSCVSSKQGQASANSKPTQCWLVRASLAPGTGGLSQRASVRA